MLDQSLLCDNISIDKFKQLLDRYDSLIEQISSTKQAKSGQKTLVELDQFRYYDAVDLFQSKNSKQTMKLDDVKTLVDWKLRHGKFRPTLMKLVSSNDEDFVERTIQEAMENYWVNSNSAKALDKITKLKGIGPATASLLLSVHDPDHIIFFSDEAFYWLCCKGQKSSIKYNAKEYQALDAAAQVLIRRLEVNATDIEKVAYVVVREGGSDNASTDRKAAPASDVAPSQVDSLKKSAKRKTNNSADSAENTDSQTHVRRSKRGKTR